MTKPRALILTERGNPLFRQDFTVNGNDNLEQDIATFVVQMARKKGMVDPKRVVYYINKMEQCGLDVTLDYLSVPSNVTSLVTALRQTSTELTSELKTDLRVRFSKKHIIECLILALKEPVTT